jgi:hypothetical protein
MRAATIASIAAFVILSESAIAFAQPEDRQRDPTTSSSGDACDRLGVQRERASAPPPGSEGRVAPQRGGTLLAGVGRPARDAAAGLPGAQAPTDPLYQDCLRQRDR